MRNWGERGIRLEELPFPKETSGSLDSDAGYSGSHFDSAAPRHTAGDTNRVVFLVSSFGSLRRKAE